jgi:hypothetical protein
MDINMQLGRTKAYKTKICCFAKHTAFMSKRKDVLAQNQDNMYKCSDMSTRRLLFQSTSTIKCSDMSTRRLLFQSTSTIKCSDMSTCRLLFQSTSTIKCSDKSTRRLLFQSTSTIKIQQSRLI